jgi:hypothetical protein
VYHRNLTRILDKTHLSAYNHTMRRKQGVLLPIEFDIIKAIKNLLERNEQIYGWHIAKEIKSMNNKRWPISYGTLYRALKRLVDGGYLTAYWEDEGEDEKENRPRRRFYKLTGKEVGNGAV